MAIMRPITEAVVEERESTWRTNLETPSNGAQSIQFYRETVGVDESGNPVGQPAMNMTPVTRQFTDVAEETVEIAAGRVTFTDLIDGLAQFGDRWAEEQREAGVGGSEPTP